MRVATSLTSGTAANAARSATTALKAKLDAQPGFISVFASTQQPLKDVLAEMSRAFPDALVVGCSTAGEFAGDASAGDKDAKGSVACFALAGDFRVTAGFGASLARNPEAAVTAATASLAMEDAAYPHRTAIVLLDALAGVSEETVLLLASVLGDTNNLAGGAAGDDLQMKAPLVGVARRGEAQVSNDALVVVSLLSKSKVGVGVCHGHRGLSGPLRVTRAEGAVVYEVEGRPAWDVWSEQTAAAAAKRGLNPATLHADQVGAYLLQFEAGLDTNGGPGSEKVRAPLARGADGSLSFACGIPQGSVVRITESDPGPQIDSAREAATRSRAQLGGAAVAGALVFDCICRNLILGDRFGTAVSGIRDALGGAPIAGFESYGEVALNAGDMSGFHNTTTVVLTFAV